MLVNLDLSRLKRNEQGVVAEVEDARELARNLYKLLEMVSFVFEAFPPILNMQLSIYMIGAYLLLFEPEKRDTIHQEGLKLLQEDLGIDLNELLGLAKLEPLDKEAILKSVEEFFKRKAE